MDLLNYLQRAFDVPGVSRETKMKFVQWYLDSGNTFASLERVVQEASIADRKVRRLFDELVNAKVMEENVEEDTRTPIPDVFEHPHLGIVNTPGYRFETKYFDLLNDRAKLERILQ